MNHWIRWVSLVLITFALPGCSTSADRASEEPTGTPSSATTSSPSEAQSAVEEVAPATGTLLAVQGSQLRIPGHWEADSQLLMQVAGHDPEDPLTFMTLFRFPQINRSIDELTRENATRRTWDFKLKRRADVTVDGHVASHLEGKVYADEYVVLFSTLWNGESLELQFNFANGEPKVERDEIVQSVLATWEFTS
ncbi:MAG: hypothetical protein JWN68_866 [Nocardioides sp.]|jgi:hypothetical protein|uniref:hypothetical protein n=1 Tax=Nocardioides sp. TaxID=35761 RepID=UPI00260AF722|nr:hypothetical protein [Nocardioides sp.]MCW2832913.1 hypothetical protein [Nocardioides sp.]